MAVSEKRPAMYSQESAIAATSAIGPTWPPKENLFSAIRGIDTREVVRSTHHLVELSSMTERLLNTHSHISRVSIRAVVDNSVLLRDHHLVRKTLEAILPLRGTGDGFDTMSLIYLGANKVVRACNPAELARYKENVEKARQRKRLSLHEIIQKIQEKGYELRELPHALRTSDINIQNQIKTLYTRFGWNSSEVTSLLTVPNNFIVIALLGQKIVSAVRGEVATLAIGNRNLRIAEITDAATDEAHQGKGLYTAVAAQLLRYLAERSIHIAYGECNGSEPGVLNASKALWRTFACETVESMNLKIGGYLPQHVSIAGTPRSTIYNDLFPSFITTMDLDQFSIS